MTKPRGRKTPALPRARNQDDRTTFGVSNVLLVMMIPFNVMGLFGCGSSMLRFCNSLAGSVFSYGATAEAQRRPALTAQHVSGLGLEPGARGLVVG